MTSPSVRRGGLAAALVAACSLTSACASPESGSTTPESRTAAPTETPDVASAPPSPDVPPLTRCSDVVPPAGGFGEGDFGADLTTGTATLNFSDTRDGRYRNITYVVAYRTDPTCRTSPEVARLLDRLDLPDWQGR